MVPGWVCRAGQEWSRQLEGGQDDTYLGDDVTMQGFTAVFGVRRIWLCQSDEGDFNPPKDYSGQKRVGIPSRDARAM